jgi:two-component system, cell cycle response regulator DivK
VPAIVVTAADLSEVDHRRLNNGVLSGLGRDGLLGEVMSLVAHCRSGEMQEAGHAMAKLLYVEDNEDNIYMLTRRLKKLGFEVVVARDGEDGVSLTGAERTALVLMDLSLPVVDGWEATRRLKDDPATKDIPVIALSAHAMAGDREKALAAGCDEYDTKPVDFARLLSKIRALLPEGGDP